MHKYLSSLLITVLIICVGFPASVQGQTGGDHVFGFLNIPASARTAGLGGNHVALDQGGTGLFTTNPAYLNENTHKQLSASYLNQLSDIYLGSANFSWHLDGTGTLATGFHFVNYGDFTRYDSDGIAQGSFGAYDFSWNTAFSRNIFDGLRAGLGTTLITSGYDNYQSTAIALFGGLLYRFNDNLTRFGVSFQHLGVQLTPFDETKEDLPFNLSAGASHRLQHLPLRFNLTLHSLDQWEIPVFDDERSPGFSENLFRHMRFGLELLFSDNFNLRLGYDHLKNEELKTDRRIDLSGTSIGLGIVVRNIDIDISRTSWSETGSRLQLGIATRL